MDNVIIARRATAVKLAGGNSKHMTALNEASPSPAARVTYMAIICIVVDYNQDITALQALDSTFFHPLAVYCVAVRAKYVIGRSRLRFKYVITDDRVGAW